MNHPAALKDFRHAPGGFTFGCGNHGNRLLRVGIKLLALGVDCAHTAHFQSVHKLPVGGQNAITQSARVFSGHFNRLFKAVDNREKVLCKLFNPELLSLLHVFSAAAARVVHFSDGAHVKVVVFCGLGVGFLKGLCGLGEFVNLSFDFSGFSLRLFTAGATAPAAAAARGVTGFSRFL